MDRELLKIINALMENETEEPEVNLKYSLEMDRKLLIIMT